MRAQFAKTMLELGMESPSLVVLVGDIGAFGLRHFQSSCPGRFFNFGIREQSMVGAAAGLAMQGYVPVVHSITPFVVERCFEQIKDDFCYHSLAANIVSVGGGIDYSALGGTHHSYSDLALLKSLPGTKVFVPGSAKEFDYLFRAHYDSGSVNYFRLSDRSHGIEFDSGSYEDGKISVIKSGSDVTVITMGHLLNYAQKAVSDLGSRASCELLYVNSLKPFDSETVIQSLMKTKQAVVIEDHSAFGGLADEVRRALSESSFPYAIRSLALPDHFLRDYGNRDYLAATAGIDPKAISKAILSMLKRKIDEHDISRYRGSSL